MLSDHYFGDVEALDEGRSHSGYFDATFIVPSSFSLQSLNNKRNFLIVGRKGAGKTAVQFHFASKLRNSGYLTHFFSFYSDLRPSDYNDAARTQKIDMLGVSNTKNIFLNYDFRDIWTRTFLLKIAETLQESGESSKFTKVALGNRGRLSSIFEGILRSASLKVEADFGVAAAEIGFDLKSMENNELSIAKYSQILRELLLHHHKSARMYLFIDELVFSRLDAADDEVRIRAAMVRDIFRAVRDLNNVFGEAEIDIHLVCSVRPEIRDLINELDAEIGKIFDGKSVQLNWKVTEDEDSALMQILKLKVKHSNPNKGTIEFENFFTNQISFNNKSVLIPSYLTTNTWGRPRDIVQLLISIASVNPDSESISSEELKNSLAEYSKRSFIEIMDEVSVRNGPTIAQTLREKIRKRQYPTAADFEDKVLSDYPPSSRKQIIDDLFNFGVIGNIDKRRIPARYYWAHRGDRYVDREAGVVVHSGLWHELRLQ